MPTQPMTQEQQVAYERALQMNRKHGGTAIFLDGLDLVSLPPEICQITSLEVLCLNSNRLKSLPPEIGQLTHLRELRLENNQLTSLPPEIGQLSVLHELMLLRNRLADLPPEIGRLSKLGKLDLAENNLSGLPPEISQLASLQELWLQDNQLAMLPDWLGKLQKLKWLFLHGNPALHLPPSVLGGDSRKTAEGFATAKVILEHYFKMQTIQNTANLPPAEPVAKKSSVPLKHETVRITLRARPGVSSTPMSSKVVEVPERVPEPPPVIMLPAAPLPPPVSAPSRAAASSPGTGASLYDVFISAKSEDYPHARVAVAFLRKAGLRIFFSEQELPEMGNSDYFEAIDDALEGSRHMLVVTTSHAHSSSRWVKKEWKSYLNEQLSGRKNGNLVTLLCGDMTIAELPYSLRQHEARRHDELPSLLNYFKSRGA